MTQLEDLKENTLLTTEEDYQFKLYSAYNFNRYKQIFLSKYKKMNIQIF